MLDRIMNSKNIIHRALDGAAVRNRVITENIANNDTPGYKRKVVNFEAELQRALDKKDFDKREIDKVPIRIVEDQPGYRVRMDGNNVDIDREMSELTKNSIQYDTLIKMAGFNSVKTVLEQSR